MSHFENFTTPYDLIITDEKLGNYFVEATKLIKSKAMPARDIALQYLKLFTAKQSQDPDFVIELYETLTKPKQRDYLLAGIKGK